MLLYSCRGKFGSFWVLLIKNIPTDRLRNFRFNVNTGEIDWTTADYFQATTSTTLLMKLQIMIAIILSDNKVFCKYYQCKSSSKIKEIEDKNLEEQKGY